MFSWIKRQFAKRKHDKIVEEYRSVACNIGDAISYMHMGSVNITLRGKSYNMRDPEIYHILDELEEAYASLGYRVVPLDNWIDYAGWGVNIDHLWLVKRDPGERPVFTKLEPKRELPKSSDLLEKVWTTGKPHEGMVNEDGDMEIRQVGD